MKHKISRKNTADCQMIWRNERTIVVSVFLLRTHSHKLNLCDQTTAIDWICKRFVSTVYEKTEKRLHTVQYSTAKHSATSYCCWTLRTHSIAGSRCYTADFVHTMAMSVVRYFRMCMLSYRWMDVLFCTVLFQLYSPYTQYRSHRILSTTQNIPRFLHTF